MKTFILTLSILCMLVISASAQCTDTLTLSSPTDDVSEDSIVFQGYEMIEGTIVIDNGAGVSIYANNILLQSETYVELGSQLLVIPDCLPLNECTPVVDLGTAVLSSGTIQAGIQIISKGTVPAGTDVSFKAGQIIELQNGFTSDANADLEIIIEGCAPAGGN